MRHTFILLYKHKRRCSTSCYKRMNMKQMIYGYETIKEILLQGEYDGRKFVIVSYGTHPCAYVEMPYKQLNNLNIKQNDCEKYLEDKINCHGGITYFGRLDHVPCILENIEYFGWDYAHACDFTGIYLNPIFNEKEDLNLLKGKKWTTEEIFEEVKDVIHQLEELE